MSIGVLNVDFGIALGKHKLNYTLEHTGKGYICFIADMPSFGFKETHIESSDKSDKKISHLRKAINAYEQLLTLKSQIPLFIPDKLTFEINKIKDFDFAKMPKTFATKVSIDIQETKKLLDELETAIKVERTRSGDFW